MSQENDSDLLYEGQYKTMKKKLKELKNLRIDSVREDIEDLKGKIIEHKKIHAISVKELQQQNERLRTTISEINKAQRQMKEMNNKISNLKRKIVAKESSLGEILQYPELHVHYISEHLYQISVGSSEKWIFTLATKSDMYQYTPYVLPSPKMPEFCSKTVQFERVGIDNFCREIIKLARELCI